MRWNMTLMFLDIFCETNRYSFFTWRKQNKYNKSLPSGTRVDQNVMLVSCTQCNPSRFYQRVTSHSCSIRVCSWETQCLLLVTISLRYSFSLQSQNKECLEGKPQQPHQPCSSSPSYSTRSVIHIRNQAVGKLSLQSFQAWKINFIAMP